MKDNEHDLFISIEVRKCKFTLSFLMIGVLLARIVKPRLEANPENFDKKILQRGYLHLEIINIPSVFCFNQFSQGVFKKAR